MHKRCQEFVEIEMPSEWGCVGLCRSGQLKVGKCSCLISTPPPQVVFPSGRLAHHIAVQLGSMSAEKRMPCVLTEWLPRLLGRVDDTFMSQVGRPRYLRAFTTSVT